MRYKMNWIRVVLQKNILTRHQNDNLLVGIYLTFYFHLNLEFKYSLLHHLASWLAPRGYKKRDAMYLFKIFINYTTTRP